MTPLTANCIALTLALLGLASLLGLPLTGPICGAAAIWMMLGEAGNG